MASSLTLRLALYHSLTASSTLRVLSCTIKSSNWVTPHWRDNYLLLARSLARTFQIIPIRDATRRFARRIILRFDFDAFSGAVVRSTLLYSAQPRVDVQLIFSLYRFLSLCFWAVLNGFSIARSIYFTLQPLSRQLMAVYLLLRMALRKIVCGTLLLLLVGTCA